MREIGIPIKVTPELYCDNLSSVYLTANPAYHKRSKHFELDYHYVRERVALRALVVRHIPALADIFTKSLPYNAFDELRFKLGVCLPPTPSLRGTIERMGQNDPGSKMGLSNSAQPREKPAKELSLSLNEDKLCKSKVQMTLVKCKESNGVKLANRFSTLDCEAT